VAAIHANAEVFDPHVEFRWVGGWDPSAVHLLGAMHSQELVASSASNPWGSQAHMVEVGLSQLTVDFPI
jgi:hypothetical protein